MQQHGMAIKDGMQDCLAEAAGSSGSDVSSLIPLIQQVVQDSSGSLGVVLVVKGANSAALEREKRLSGSIFLLGVFYQRGSIPICGRKRRLPFFILTWFLLWSGWYIRSWGSRAWSECVQAEPFFQEV